jgi:hypothetical protein
MVCKIIEQLDKKQELVAGLKSRESSALACTNQAHAHLIRSLKKETKEREDRDKHIAALRARQPDKEHEEQLLWLAFCM